MGRVAVDDRIDVGAVLHDRQVQQNFTRPLPLAGNLVALHVDDAEVDSAGVEEKDIELVMSQV